MLRDAWSYDGLDPAILLWAASLSAWGFDIRPGDRVLELGCCESDWAARLKRTVPDVHVVGIDVRPCPDYGGDVAIVGDASNPDIANCGAFDWVVSLGAVEHFGLGFYGDAKQTYSDRAAIENAWAWLKPGGSIYLDVPWTPGLYQETSHYRVYSDAALAERLQSPRFVWRARGWAPDGRERELTPVRPMVPFSPFWFIAQWGEKPQ